MGLITLISKKEKDLLALKHWRPLTMLNLEFKILSKAMAERMKPLLNELIADHQTGFMKGRHISENIRRCFEIVKYTKKHKIPSIILSIDFQKCFDMLSHKAIHGAFEYFNFGPTFTRYVMLLLTNLQIYTQNFGFVSKPFTKQRGSNQGCNISPSCYLLCGEIMSRKLLNNPNIKGISMGKTNKRLNNLLSQFVDDTVLFLEFEELCLYETIKTLSHIEANTGLIISYDKTLIYHIGSIANSDAMIYTQKPIKWTNEPFTLLGIRISNCEEEAKNYDETVQKMENILTNWYYRQFTIMGKTTIINVLCESLFVYKLSVTLDVSTETVDKIEKLIDHFIWKGKKAKIAKKTLQTSKKCGGIRLFNIKIKQKALKIAWIPKIKQNTFFNICLYDNVNVSNFDRIFECNLNACDCLLYVNPKEFWGQLMLHWCDYNFTNPKLTQVGHEILWYNSFIKIDSKPIYKNNYVNSGIIQIKDLLFENEKRFMSLAEVSTKFNVSTNWLEYQAIILAIPKEWKKELLNNGVMSESSTSKHEWISCNKNMKISSMVYKTLIEDHTILPKYATRWAKDNVLIDLSKFERTIKLLYIHVKPTKLRDFQYRLMLNKLPCNVELAKWKILEGVNAEKCNWCKVNPETIYHVLYECKFAKRIWNFLNTIILNVFANLEITDLIYNDFSNTNVSNVLAIILKQFLYRNQCMKMIPNISKKELYINFNAELYLARNDRQ